jgi:hypothetical protein
MDTTKLAQDTLLDEQETQTEAKSQVTREVTVTRSPLIFSRIYVNQYQKPGTKTLEVKQKLTTLAVYSGVRITSNLNDSIFELEDFGKAAEPRKYESVETRVAWILVPVSAPDAEVMAAFEKFKNTGIIFKILSNSPTFDDNQWDAINRGLKTYDELADKQAVRYGIGDTNGNAGKLILDKEKNAQYKRTGFSRVARNDEDFRYGKSDVYQTPKIKAEMEGAGVLMGQTI